MGKTSVVFERGDCVVYNPLIKPIKQDMFFREGPAALRFNSMVEFKPVSGTYVWAVFSHLIILYVIEHPDGFEKQYFLSSKGFCDGFESVDSSLLKDDVKYIYADEEQLRLINKK